MAIGVVNTTSNVPPGVQTYYDRALLERGKPHLAYMTWAQLRPLPTGTGKNIKFRRLSALSAATTPIPEGVTPDGSSVTVSDLTAAVSMYGDFLPYTDVMQITVDDETLNDFADLQGDQFALTIDTVIRMVLAACASSTNCSNGSNTKTPTEFAKKDITGVIKTLRGNNAKFVSEIVKAQDGYASYPVRAAYFGIAHTDLIDALEAVTGYKNVAEYADPGARIENEEGMTQNVRWVTSTNADRTLGTPDQYKCPIIGQNAYGATKIQAGELKSIIKALGSAGTEDPLDQRGTIGWKTYFVSRILNDNFMHNLVCSNLAGT